MTQLVYQPDQFYDIALATIHDNYYGQLALDAFQIIIKLFKDLDPTTQFVVDLGYGSGILAKELSELGFKVSGVDISQPVLEIAIRKAPKATFVQSSLFEFPIPVCNAICAIGEPICYLFGSKSNKQACHTLFQDIFDRLKPNGYFIFDILTTEVSSATQTKIIENELMTMFPNISIDKDFKILTREMIFFVKEGNNYIRQKEIHTQCLFDKIEIENLLNEIGFHTILVDKYNNNHFRQGHLGFLCKK